MKLPIFIKEVPATRQIMGLNTLLGIIGLIGVWHFSHSWAAIGCAFIAALHIQFTKP